MKISSKKILLSGLVLLTILAGSYRYMLEKGRFNTSLASKLIKTKNSSLENKEKMEKSETLTDNDENLIDSNTEENCFGTCSENDYFIKLKREREITRKETIDSYNKIVEKDEATPDIKNDALKKINNILKNMEKESNIENLIKAKKYDDAISYISEKDANVVVKTKELNNTIVAQIKDIITTQTGLSSEKVKISAHI